MAITKPAHALIVDAGPILKDDPSLSTLRAKCDHLYTTSAIISEIRDPVAKARFESTYLPFISIRDPGPPSTNLVTDFARKTGDLSVLSRADIGILALAYELECERNGGDWRLRRSPGQKRLNGSPPVQTSVLVSEAAPSKLTDKEQTSLTHRHVGSEQNTQQSQGDIDEIEELVGRIVLAATDEGGCSNHRPADYADPVGGKVMGTEHESHAQSPPEAPDDSEQEVSDSDGWITPSNLRKHQAHNNGFESSLDPRELTMQVATLTTDFAMQNVLIQMNLNLMSTSLRQIRHIRTYILRCHACFQTTKVMAKQFCPRCGQPSLTRVSCSTNHKGEFQMHLKKTMQWNSRGNRYSIPKPVAGVANQKSATIRGGGKGAWGQNLILAEDQKEYTRAIGGQGRRKEKSLMDEDHLPSILTGNRSRTGGKPKIGAGRNVNSKKR